MAVIITAKKDKFRRCGAEHSKEPQTYKDGHWTAEQLKLLKAEPMLVVQEVADQPEKDQAKPEKDQAKKEPKK
jgi:hypothetical protein